MPYRLHAHVAPPRLMATPPDLAGDLTRQATARALGVTEDDARTLIANGGPVAECAARDFAGHLCGYLAVLGLAVLQPGDRDGDRWDLALQPRDPAAVPALAVAIAQVLRRDAVAVAAALAGPVGMVIGGGDMTDGQRARLERMAGLRVLAAQPATARFDLLPGRPADPATLPALSRMLDRLGHRRCPLTGAVAVDIGRAERDALLRRFPAAGLVAVCRAFQRFDLVLAGVGGMTPADAGRLSGGAQRHPPRRLRHGQGGGRPGGGPRSAPRAGTGLPARLRGNRVAHRHAPGRPGPVPGLNPVPRCGAPQLPGRCRHSRRRPLSPGGRLRLSVQAHSKR